MISYAPLRKIIKVTSAHRIPKRERHTSLSECLESNKEPRRRRCRWKPLFILLLFSSALYLVSIRRAHLFPDIYERVNRDVVMDSVEKPEEYIPPKNGEDYEAASIPPSENPVHISKNNTLGVIEQQKKSEGLPPCKLKKPYGKFSINKTSVSLTATDVHPLVTKGGYYHPTDCKAKHRVGIIVPYRDREHNLGIFLYNIHPFLIQQKLEYQIFVIEQAGQEPFNKGRLFNAGFREIMKFNTFQCIVLHDLDLLPMNLDILYTCPTLPRHMCAMVDDKDARRELNITYDYKSVFGGVIAMSVEQFERANGYSNLYFGWGGEDNDMFWRLRASGYPVMRYNKTVGVYTVLPHRREPENIFRFHLLSGAMDRYKKDGLSDHEYYVISTKFLHLYTHIVVNINPRKHNITALYDKWNKSVYKL